MIIDDCSHLTYGSSKKVKVKCEKCNLIRFGEYKHARTCFERTGNNLCKKCCLTPEAKSKISKAKIGIPRSKETIEKMSTSRIGKYTGSENGMYGRNHTEEAKKRISDLNKGRLAGEKNPRFGKPLSQEIKDKIGNANKGRLAGEKNHNYKSPHLRKKPFNEQIRKCEKATIWKKQCLQRDGFSCQECSQKGGHLNIDHIKPFSIILIENNIGLDFIDWDNKEQSFKEMWEKIENCKELWDVNNGRTLCVECHKKTDTYKNGTKKLLKELKG